MKLFITLLTLMLTLSVSGQQPSPSPPLCKVRGTISDPNGAVIGGLSLMTEDQNYPRAVTDINGKFVLQLAAGDYVLTLRESPDLRLFLKIVNGGVNPDDLRLRVDLRRICCFSSSGIAFPKPTSLPIPLYPAAARAIRATGTVLVTIKIDTHGKVASAKAEYGHPLLRAASLSAAHLARFESSTEIEREARLTYVFTSFDELSKDTVRYSDPYRIEIIDKTEPVDINVSKTTNRHLLN